MNSNMVKYIYSLLFIIILFGCKEQSKKEKATTNYEAKIEDDTKNEVKEKDIKEINKKPFEEWLRNMPESTLPFFFNKNLFSAKGLEQYTQEPPKLSYSAPTKYCSNFKDLSDSILFDVGYEKLDFKITSCDVIKKLKVSDSVFIFLSTAKSEKLLVNIAFTYREGFGIVNFAFLGIEDSFTYDSYLHVGISIDKTFAVNGINYAYYESPPSITKRKFQVMPSGKIKKIYTQFIDENGKKSFQDYTSKRSNYDYSQTEILKTAYVIAKNGLFYRDKPNGMKIDKFPYGKKVEVIEFTNEKFEIQDGGKVVQGQWVGLKDPNDDSKKIYVFDGFLGNVSEMKLLTDELNIVKGFYTPKNENSYFYDNGKEIRIDSLIDFQIIGKNEFDRLKNTASNYVSRDSSGVSRNMDTLIVNGHKFVDKNIDNDGKIRYRYIGKIDFLDKFILKRFLWENADYILVDNKSGEIDAENQKLIDRAMSFSGMNRLGYPRISPNKKYMLTLEPAIYTHTAGLNLFTIKGGKILGFEFSLLFKTWAPVNNEVYWVSDKEFITEAAPINVIHEGEWAEVVPNSTYLKVTIK